MSAAQDEFNELMRDKEHSSSHPEDAGLDAHISADQDEENTDRDTAFKTIRNRSKDGADEDDIETNPRPSMSQARSIVPGKRYGANTGPKGVISDAQNFRDSKRLQRIQSRLANGSVPQSFTGLSIQEQQLSEKTHWTDDQPQHGDEEEDEDDDEDDDDFMQSWRSGRLQQLQGGNVESPMRQSDNAARRWGSLQTVDGEGYLNAVDHSPPGTAVLVYIYDDTSDVSAALETCVRALARKHGATRFVRLDHIDAEMEPAGVPALLAYRDGEKFAGLVPLLNEIPEDADVSSEALEDVLRRRQIL